VREAADLAHHVVLPALAPLPPKEGLRPNSTPKAGDLSFDPDPELPSVAQPEIFSEATEEPGPAEANDLMANDDNITPDEACDEAPTPDEPSAEGPEPMALTPELVILTPVLEGLNFRMIQYARHAAQLVRNRRDFGVIYAPNWPAWLAALEIRNSTGQPMVLYAAGLAADFLSPAERGWLLEVERMTLRRARVVLVPNEEVRARLREQYGEAIGEVRVVAAADEATVQQVLREAAIG
jgi:hypothetical protein